MVNLHTCACNTVYPVFNSSTFCFFKNLEFAEKHLKCLPHVGVLVTYFSAFMRKVRYPVPCFGNVSLFKMRIRITFRILLITLMRIRILSFTLIRIRILPFNLTIHLFTLMRIRILLFTLMRIRIQLSTLMRIRIQI